MPTPQKNHQPERETKQWGKSGTHHHTSLIPLPSSIAQSIPQLLTPHLPTPPLSCPFHPSVTHSIPNSPFHPSIPHSIPQLPILSLSMQQARGRAANPCSKDVKQLAIMGLQAGYATFTKRILSSEQRSSSDTDTHPENNTTKLHVQNNAIQEDQSLETQLWVGPLCTP